jgi:hypothetical protein
VDISDAWGYAAVFRRSTGDWQGFIVPDPEAREWRDSVKIATEVATYASMDTPSPDPDRPIAPEGALAGALADGVFSGDWTRVGIFASTLAKMTGKRFWIVAAEVDDEGGFDTKFNALKASTPEEARDLINMLGAVLQVDQAFNELMTTARETN